MDLIDDEGRLLGHVNAIDALALVVALSVVLVGAVAATTGGTIAASESEQTTGVTVRATVAPYVAEAIETGHVPTEGIQRVDAASVMDRSVAVTVNRSGTNVTVDRYQVGLALTLTTRRGPDGRPHFQDGPLYIGRRLTLDLGTTLIDGTVVEIH